MMPTVRCSAIVEAVGWLAIGGNASAALGLLLFDYQSGGHGEMGSFYHANMPWFLGFAAWGSATGIGLVRVWRWARISTLIFSGLLTAFGILGVVAFLSMLPGTPTGNLSPSILLAARIVPAFSFMVPTAIGCLCLFFFSRKEVKTYFGQAGTGVSLESESHREL